MTTGRINQVRRVALLKLARSSSEEDDETQVKKNIVNVDNRLIQKNLNSTSAGSIAKKKRLLCDFSQHAFI